MRPIRYTRQAKNRVGWHKIPKAEVELRLGGMLDAKITIVAIPV